MDKNYYKGKNIILVTFATTLVFYFLRVFIESAFKILLDSTPKTCLRSYDFYVLNNASLL